MSASGDGAASTDGVPGSDPGAGGAGLGTPPGFVPASELEKERQRAASFQSAADRANARVEQVMTEVKGVKELLSSFDPNAIVSQIQTGIAQARALETEAAKLRTDFPNAAEELYQRSWQTPEELRAAVEQSHQSKLAEIQAIRESVGAELRQEIAEKHGINLAPAAPASSDAPAGKTTAADVAQMSMRDRLRMDDAELERIAREE